MSVTVEQVFTLSLALCEALDKNGNPVLDDSAKRWKARSPGLCDSCQNELAAVSPVFETVEIDCSAEPLFTDGKTKQYEISDRLLSVSRIFSGNSPLPQVSVSENRLFVPESFEYTVHILCRLKPLPITSFAAVFSVNDSAVRSLAPYFLASDFLLEENPARAQLYLSLYRNGVELLKGAQASVEDILDAYGGERNEFI